MSAIAVGERSALVLTGPQQGSTPLPAFLDRAGPR
jgi:hypothetical protein